MDQAGNGVLFNSELGTEILMLQSNKKNLSLDPTNVKQIIVSSEDTRIALRLSEIESVIQDQEQLARRIESIKATRLNLLNGQQCVRDFFVCLNENMESWPDVYSFLSFELTHSTTCLVCGQQNKSQTVQLYTEIPVPPTNTNLSDYVEEVFNQSTQVELNCEGSCQQISKREKRSALTSCRDSEFIIILLARAVLTMEGYHIVRNIVKATNMISIRYN